MSADEIDLLVSVAGENHDALERHVPVFLETLRSKCNLDRVNVSLVLRECLPLPRKVRAAIDASGFKTHNCSLPMGQNRREDTSQVCDWMVNNIGQAPWVAISHFDIEFEGDYFRWARTVMDGADMIGMHHDGIMLITRSAYERSLVGFVSLEGFRAVRNTVNGECRIAAHETPADRADSYFCLALDVGELLWLRAAYLGFKHIWHRKESDPNDLGKSDLFIHHRDGSILYRNISDQQRQSKLMQQQINARGEMVTIIHFVSEVLAPPPSQEGPPKLQWRIACMPNMTEFGETMYHPAYMRTNDIRATTCPQCKKTQVFLDLQKMHNAVTKS